LNIISLSFECPKTIQLHQFGKFNIQLKWCAKLIKFIAWGLAAGLSTPALTSLMMSKVTNGNIFDWRTTAVTHGSCVYQTPYCLA
jgi:hypothetical protein